MNKFFNLLGATVYNFVLLIAMTISYQIASDHLVTWPRAIAFYVLWAFVIAAVNVGEEQ